MQAKCVVLSHPHCFRSVQQPSPLSCTLKRRPPPCGFRSFFGGGGRGAGKLLPRTVLARKSHRPSLRSPAVRTEAVARKFTGENLLASALQGYADRAEADSEFLFKLCVEIMFDQFITCLTNLAVLGLNPLLWSTAAIAQATMLHLTALFNDAVLVWYLAPRTGQAVSDAESKISHCFQQGNGITAKDRVNCWFAKFSLYSTIGSLTALLSAVFITALTAQECSLRYFATAALVGAISLGVSSNTRYQIVNGIEVLIYAFFPKLFARFFSVGIRVGNNFLGARLFLCIAAFAGL